MGLLGRMTGWNQTKDAHNAVLASYLAETASAEMKREIANRLILIMQRASRGRVDDSQSILEDLSTRPRIVQMNFIALACNSLGIPPGVGGLSFADTDNPYLADDQRSLDRIGVAINDLSRRSRQRLDWPGNDVRVDFLSWAGFQLGVSSGVGGGARATSQPDPKIAAKLAFGFLLGEVIDMNAVMMAAKELSELIDAETNEELALVTALFFFTQEGLVPHLHPVQVMARLGMIQWLHDGVIRPATAKSFESQLYVLYKA